MIGLGNPTIELRSLPNCLPYLRDITEILGLGKLHSAESIEWGVLNYVIRMVTDIGDIFGSVSK